ncbi:hypothetical protein DFH06DRAFT_1483891 [Mycena polygramma]|nr:hypothetical protein DFH06DRAFT_1483891 [Mycena polygramma]
MSRPPCCSLTCRKNPVAALFKLKVSFPPLVSPCLRLPVTPGYIGPVRQYSLYVAVLSSGFRRQWGSDLLRKPILRASGLASVKPAPVFKAPPLLPDSMRATELRQILRSNVLPPVSVEASLQDVIGRAPSELARYDAEIQRIQSVLSALVSERATLEAHVQACRSVFSPVRRLPMELLGVIFGMYLPPYETPAPSDPDHSDSFAERRRLANSDLLRALSLLGIALQRSGGFPLSISLSFSRDADGRAVIQLLAQHAERWQHFSCTASGETGHYLSSVKGHLPLLKTSYLDTNWNETDVFETAPALTAVTVQGWPGTLPKLPWSQIRQFGSTCTRYRTVPTCGLSIAQLLGRGAAFRFQVEITRTTAKWPVVSSDVQSLSLELGFSSEAYPGAATIVGQIFKSLTLPHLQELRLLPSRDTCRNDKLPGWNTE